MSMQFGGVDLYGIQRISFTDQAKAFGELAHFIQTKRENVLLSF